MKRISSLFFSAKIKYTTKGNCLVRKYTFKTLSSRTTRSYAILIRCFFGHSVSLIYYNLPWLVTKSLSRSRVVMTWLNMREHEHNMSPLIIKNKTSFTREKLAFISEYHLKGDVLWRLLEGHEFLFNKPVPRRGGSRGARVPTLFLDQTEAWKAEKNYFETTPLISGV